MAKMGCAKCGGTKKMKLGGSAVAKAPVNMYGIPQENMGTSSQMGFGKKGGTLKVHPLTAFRKANEARQAVVKKSLPKAQDGGTSSTKTNMFGKTKEISKKKAENMGTRFASKKNHTFEDVGDGASYTIKPRAKSNRSVTTTFFKKGGATKTKKK